MMSFQWDPIFASPIFLVLIAVIVIAVPWLVPVAGRGVTPKQRRALQWLRTLTGLVMLLAVFRPSIVRTDSLPTEATLVVLLDRSRSMTLPADSSQSRSTVQNELFARLRPAIESLDKSLSLKTMTYADKASDFALGDETLKELQTPPSGNATDIGAALDAAVQSSPGRPLAGVVLLGDGVDVLPASDKKSAPRDNASASRILASLDVPLWTVPIGPPGDLGQVRDAEVAELAEQFGLFSGNEANVDFVVRTRALAGKSVTARVTLTREGAGNEPVEVAVRSITPERTDDVTSLAIPIVAPEPGRYLMKVSVDGQDGETLLSNNSQIAFVDVRQGGGRVLYLEGQPRLEQAYLLQTLRRFPDLQIAYRWIAADTKPRWPIDLDLGRNLNAFDVVIIGDLPAEAIGTEQLTVIADRVNKGAALLMIGGIDSFAAGGYASSPLANVLPIKLDKTTKDLVGDVPIVIVNAHPITDLVTSPDLKAKADAWKSLPPLIGANRFSDLRIAPGIDTLLESPDADPLLVVGEYGAGRVAAFAGDSTWRWQRQGKATEYRRFWRQMLLWLLNRDSADDGAITIELAKRRADVGQRIAYVVSGGEPEAISLAIVSEDNSVIELEPGLIVSKTDNADARIEGEIANLPAGMYRIRASVEGNDALTSEKSFQILEDNAELRQPFADHSYLSQLASQTASAGGAMFLPDSIDELVGVITQLRRNAQAPIVSKYRLGDTAASAWPLFIILASLLGIEWYLRKRWGLA